MRTALTLEDDVAGKLREIACLSGRSFGAVVNDALRAGIGASRFPDASEPCRPKPVSMNQPIGGHDLDRSLALANRLEDGELVRKLLLESWSSPPPTCRAMPSTSPPHCVGGRGSR